MCLLLSLLERMYLIRVLSITGSSNTFCPLDGIVGEFQYIQRDYINTKPFYSTYH